MRNLQINNNKLEIYEDEEEKLEQYAKERGGIILWGMIYEKIKEGKTYIEYLPYMCRDGIIIIKLSDI